LPAINKIDRKNSYWPPIDKGRNNFKYINFMHKFHLDYKISRIYSLLVSLKNKRSRIDPQK
jgi:hypothetical protein